MYKHFHQVRRQEAGHSAASQSMSLLEVVSCIRFRPSCRPLVVDGSLELRLAGRPTAPSWSQILTSFCRVSSDVLCLLSTASLFGSFAYSRSNHYAQKKDIQATPVLKEPPKSQRRFVTSARTVEQVQQQPCERKSCLRLCKHDPWQRVACAKLRAQD